MSIRKLGIGGLATVLWVIVIGALALPAFAASVEPESLSVTDVSSSSATLNATVDPEGVEAGYVFEYAKSPYEGGVTPASSVEVGAGSAGSGAGGVPVSVHVQNLEPSTTYYYRVVVAGVDSEAGSFITQESGDAFALPEGRAWELVSPPDKHGAGIEPFPHGGGVIQAAEDGGAFTYVADGAPVSEAQGNRAAEYSQLLSRRGSAGGWSTQDIATPNAAFSALNLGSFTEYEMFSPDLSSAALEPKGDTPLPPLPANAEKTIYLRDDTTGSFTPLVSEANVLPGAKFGEEEDDRNIVRFEGASPDLSHVILSSPEALTEGSVKPARPESGSNLYEWAGGRLRLVNILPPNGEGKEEPAINAGEVGGHSTLGTIGAGIEVNVRGAVSSDGERIVWEGEFAETGRQHHIYLRAMGRGETLQMDTRETGATGGTLEAKARFQGASSVNSDGAGMQIFFTDEQRLTSDSHAEFGEPDLYVFEVTSGEGEPLAGHLTDLTVDSNGEESASVEGGLIGYSEDGSYVYFVAAGKLAAGAESGALNLYAEHRGPVGWEAPRLVAKLSSEDRHDFVAGLEFLTSRVSPNGQFLAFMSKERLTGYDNRDASSGAADQEVFLYDAVTGKLACASCDPTGARPEGVYDPQVAENKPLLRVDTLNLWNGQTLAGSVPGWDPVTTISAFHQPRYLSDSGELLFNSPAALVPAVVDGVENVFSYRPMGDGCGSGTESAAEVFKPASGSEPGGCVSLISSGTSGQESVFLDATANGGEVFFMTTSQLVPEDSDSAFDVYDARVCTAESPCAAGAGSVPPACSTADSCREAPAPQPAIFGSPASATFSGAGNTAPPPAVVKKVTKKTVKCKKGFTKKKNKCVKNKKPKRAKRAGHGGRTKS